METIYGSSTNVLTRTQDRNQQQYNFGNMVTDSNESTPDIIYLCTVYVSKRRQEGNATLKSTVDYINAAKKMVFCVINGSSRPLSFEAENMRGAESNPCKRASIGRLKSDIALFLTGGMTCQNGVLSHIWVVLQHWWTRLKIPKLMKNTDQSTLTRFVPGVSYRLCSKVTLLLK